ncbi:MAG: hypothetical protein JSV49_06395 [Thermoplasmata archaeon]|nr:MAG: hypothetical protein JSV49_06395 [Thermoplasmata archaeon]
MESNHPQHYYQSNSYWRSITKDNITSIYGKSETAKIADPQNKQHIFSWLLEETFDTKGNIIVYEYQADDVYTNEQYNERGVPVYERHRVDGTTHATNTYIKRIKYGNHTPFQKDAWYFQVVFDYGEHDAVNPTPEDDQHQTWNLRPDPFSRYRAGFEIRTRRRCERILMFHHFPNELGQDAYLVRSTDITYINRSLALFVGGITQTGYIKEGTGYQSKSFPPVEFTYSQADLHNRVEAIDKDSLENLPQGVDGSHYRFVDLDAEGISGILTEQAGEYYYKRANGPASYDPIKVEQTRPNMRGLQSGTQRLMDLDGDGLLSLVQLQDPTPGFFERTDDQTWEAFDHFDYVPNIDWQNPNLQFIDLNGDGFADVLYAENNHFVWFPSKAKKGFGEPRYLHKPHDEEKGPALVFADGTQSIYTAEMCADGLQDIVRIRNGEVCYWPNLGYGRFGAKVTMANAPRFTSQDQFRQDRIRLADIDGTGTTDILYLDTDSIRIWRNELGNGFSHAEILEINLPLHNKVSVQTADLKGNGTTCIVWSSPLHGDKTKPVRFVDLMGGKKPHLLEKITNNLGAETHIEYASSTEFYLEDRKACRPWVTKLPFPVHVIKRVRIKDLVSRNTFVTRYAYHHGYFDGHEREFRGFGLVEQWDTEEYDTFKARTESDNTTNLDKASHIPPILTKSWFHTGAYLKGQHISKYLEGEYYREGDESAGVAGLSKAQQKAMLLDDTILPTHLRKADGAEVPYELSMEEVREAC